MNSIQTDVVAIDTNVLIYALRESPRKKECHTFVFDKVPELHVLIPYQVILELQHNLSRQEYQRLLAAFALAKSLTWDYSGSQAYRVAHYELLGARKGDAIIAAQLEAAGVKWLISENRHFLAEIDDLPFRLNSAAEALEALAAD